MLQRLSAVGLALLLMSLPTASPAAGSGPGDFESVLKMMPAEWPVAVVAVNFKTLDENISSMVKRVTGSAPDEGVLEGLKGELGVGDWIDFSRPMAMSSDRIGGPDKPVVWARVPEATAKLKGVEGAVEENGTWKVPVSAGGSVWVKVAGDYAVIAPSQDLLTRATNKDNRSLAEELRPRLDMLTGRDAYLHVNIDPVRNSAVGGIAQFGQMAPMFAMMAGQQAGMTDPSLLTGVFTTLADAARSLMEQIAYVDISFSLDAQTARATIATGYRDGAIKGYLQKQKPASAALFNEIEDQAYTIAVGYQIPGTESPFFAYVCDQMKKSLSSMPASEGEAGSMRKSIEESVQVMRDLYGSIEGLNQVVAFTPEGMKVAGDYITSDPSKVVELTKKSLTSANALSKQFSSGANYESTGKVKIGEVDVEKFKMSIDPNNPAAAMMGQVLGDMQYGLGVRGGRVRFAMGNDKELEKTFAGKIGTPLSSSAQVKEAISQLPGKYNAIMLINLAAIPAMLGPMMGMPAAPPRASTAPPVALSVSLSGDPARVDLYVPLKTVEELAKAFNPPAPAN
jgi:hypothetical protein